MVTEESLRKQLESLHQEGSALVAAFAAKAEVEAEPFEVGYQRWYSRALPLMEQWAPERLTEFKRYYEGDRKFFWGSDGGYAIQDFILGRGLATDLYDACEETVRCFKSQLALLKAIADRIPWMALQSEDQHLQGLQLALLESARPLIKISERAAAVVAGLVLEGHLKKLAARHQLKLRKQAPPAAELIEALKEARVFDIPVWSQAVWLAEIHGRCLKEEGPGPTKLQARDLIDGTRWLLTNIF